MDPEVWWKKRTKWYTKMWMYSSSFQSIENKNNKQQQQPMGTIIKPQIDCPFTPRFGLVGRDGCTAMFLVTIHLPAAAYEMATVLMAIQILLTWYIRREKVVTQVETRSGKNDQNSAKTKNKQQKTKPHLCASVDSPWYNK